jgi:hypothetical protein
MFRNHSILLKKWTLLSPPSHIILYTGQILAISRPIDQWHEKSFVLSLGDCDGYDCLVYMFRYFTVQKALTEKKIVNDIYQHEWCLPLTSAQQPTCQQAMNRAIRLYHRATYFANVEPDHPQ